MTEMRLDGLVEYLAKLQFDQIPPDVIQKAKLCVLDTLGIALAGSLSSTGRAARDFAVGIGGREETRVYNYGNRLSCIPATYANGTMAFCYNFTDTTLTCVVHCGPVIVPTALSLAEARGKTGKDVLLAIVAGYEMMTRVGNTINSGAARMSHHKRGFHATGTTGVFGATVAATKLLGMNADQTVNAVGIAGSYAAGLLESAKVPRADVWKTHPGIAGQNGISAAMLSQHGLRGPVTVLEGKSGFFSAFGGDRVDLTKMDEALGAPFLIMDSAFKLHNCAHVWANPLDSLSRLIKSHSIQPDDVAEIRVRIPTMYTYVLPGATEGHFPTDYSEAENNPRYVMAAMMLHGRVYVEQFNDSVLHDPRMKELAGKVTIEVDGSLDTTFQGTDKSPAEVRVILKKEGRELYDIGDYPRGSPQNPATPKEIEGKFVELAGMVVDKTRAVEVAHMVSRMDQLEDIRTLVDLLVR